MLVGRTLEDVDATPMVRLALERALEIISEASRHIPAELRERHGQSVPWRQVADVGNLLRHAYHRSNVRALWAIYQDDFDDLEVAIDAMIAATPPAPSSS